MNFIIDNFDKLFNSEESLKRLEEIILDLAVKGKLVQQDPNDESASVLLEKIKAEKEQLIKDKKIKKDKDLAPITEEEIPFEVPKTWQWVRLGELGNIFNGNSVNEKEKKEKYEDLLDGVDYIATKDVDKDTNEINYNNGIKIPYDEPKFKYLKENSVLICAEGGSAGKKIAFTDREICFGNKLFAIEPYEISMYKYIFYNYKCNYFYNQFSSFMTGIIGGISSNNFKTLLFPLPPLAEQKRIVEKVDKLKELINPFREKIQKRDKARQVLKASIMNEIEKSNSNHDLLENLELIFRNFDTVVKTKEDIKDIRDLVLSLAVKGKLVPQDPNDEPASILLKKIKTEKEQLIKDKKIKKDKDLAPISEEEIPFEIPDSWEWVRFGEIYNVKSSKRIFAQDYVKEGIPFFRSKEIGELGAGKEISSELFISKEKYKEIQETYGVPNKGDILLACIGGSIGNKWIVDSRDFYYKDGNLVQIDANNYNINKYLYSYLESRVFIESALGRVSGSAYNALTIIKINNSIYPLPPLAEQKRIVLQVEKLMKVCDELEKLVEKSQKEENLLMGSIMNGLVG